MSKSVKSQKKPPPPQYQDEPTGSADAFSLHTNPEHDHYQDELPDEPLVAPPTYTDAVGASANPPAGSEAETNHSFVCLDGVAVLMGERLDTDPTYLEQVIRELAPAPPRPLVRIKGTHHETRESRGTDGKRTSRRENITDFNVTLDLTPYLLNNANRTGSTFAELKTVANDVKTHRGTILKKRMPGFDTHGESPQPVPELREWCHRYCAKSGGLRIFRFTRSMSNLDKVKLETSLRKLVYDTNYKGRIAITFPVENQYVDIYSKSTINRWRTYRWVRFLFYITFLWIFAWPYLFFATKKYAVVEVDWPFAKIIGQEKYYATVSEEVWLNTWKLAITKAVLGKQERQLGPNDLLNAERPDPQFQSGNTRVDGVVNFLSAGVRGINEVNRQLGWGYDS